MRTTAFVVAIALAWSPAALGVQQPSFRAGVDLIAVDAQVVDGSGAPIDTLVPQHFEVTLNGRRRRVVPADFRWCGRPDIPPEPRRGNGPASSESRRERGLASPEPRSGEGGRIFIIAVDASSFDVGSARAPLEAAQALVATVMGQVAARSNAPLYTVHIDPGFSAMYSAAGRRTGETERAIVR